MMIRSTRGWSAFFAVLLGIIFTVAAFWNTDSEVYLFPRIATGFMLFLALTQWAGAVITGKQHPADASTINRFSWNALLPGLITCVLYVLIMERLGFYTSSFLAFVIITSIYGKRSAIDMKALAYKVLVGLIFITILYVLFWKLLNVRTPTGILF